MAKRGQFVGTVVRNQAICAEHYRLVVAVPDFPPSWPGQFVQLASHEEEAGDGWGGAEPLTSARELEWRVGEGERDEIERWRDGDGDFLGPRGYLRRPFSIAGRREILSDRAEIDVVHRVVGKATQFLAGLKVGAKITLLGPLGGGFVIPPEMEMALMVGGGVGIPPMFYLAEILRKADKKGIAFVGAQQNGLLPLTMSRRAPAPGAEGEPVLNAQEFAAYGFPTVITTDDGSLGMKGFVTAALRKFFQGKSEIQNPKPELGRMVVFCCGPTPMMRATALLCAEFGVTCQVSLEQPMACGMGTCQSCVVRWRPAGETEASGGWRYKLTCTDGPVFDAREIVWDK